MSIPRWAYRIGSVAGSNLQTASGAVVHGLTKAGIPHINNKTSVVEAYTEECMVLVFLVDAGPRVHASLVVTGNGADQVCAQAWQHIKKVGLFDDGEGLQPV